MSGFVTIDANDVLGKVICDPSLMILDIELPSGAKIKGPTVTFSVNEADQLLSIEVYDPNGIDTCETKIYLENQISLSSVPTISQWGVIILGLFLTTLNSSY